DSHLALDDDVRPHLDLLTDVGPRVDHGTGVNPGSWGNRHGCIRLGRRIVRRQAGRRAIAGPGPRSTVRALEHSESDFLYLRFGTDARPKKGTFIFSPKGAFSIAAALVEHVFRDVDRYVGRHRQCDSVAGPAVHIHHLAVQADPQLGVIGV